MAKLTCENCSAPMITKKCDNCGWSRAAVGGGGDGAEGKGNAQGGGRSTTTESGFGGGKAQPDSQSNPKVGAAGPGETGQKHENAWKSHPEPSGSNSSSFAGADKRDSSGKSSHFVHGSSHAQPRVVDEPDSSEESSDTPRRPRDDGQRAAKSNKPLIQSGASAQPVLLRSIWPQIVVLTLTITLVTAFVIVVAW